MDLFEELRGVLAALEDAEVEYALVGGLAVAVWGAPRATKDIDLLVPSSEYDAAAAAVHPRGFTLRAEPVRFRDGMELRRITKVADGEHLTVDFILVAEQLKSAWASRQRVKTSFGSVLVVSRKELIAMKLRAGRAIDVADVEMLQDQDR